MKRAKDIILKLKNNIKIYFNDCFNFLIPAYCLCCEELLTIQERILCLNCVFQISNIELEFLNETDIIKKKFHGKLIFNHYLSFNKYHIDSMTQKLLHHFKYNGNHGIGKLLGQLYGSLLFKKELNQEFDIIVPVPIHKDKVKKRGYNQSNILGKFIAKKINIPLIASNQIIRIEDTVSQTKMLDKYERWQNVKSAFIVKNNNCFRSKRVLIVDDVVTSGATIEALGRILLDNGAKEISFLTIAYT